MSPIVDFSWNSFWSSQNLLGFVDQYVLKMFMILFFTNFKVST